MGNAVVCGAVYAALTFLAGAVLGTLRVVLIAPRIGETLAVLLELPVMVGLSWAMAGTILRRSGLRRGRPRLVMGAAGFAVLMTAEFALSLAMGQPWHGFLAGFARPAGALGLAGQLVFAAIPVLRCR